MVLWIHGFMVLWFYGFMFLWLSGFMVVWFLGFKKYQISFSCFQEDLDPISKIFKILLRGSSPFSAHVFSKMFKHLGFQFLRFTKIIFSKCSRDLFWILFRCPGVSKDKTSWFWSLVTGSEIHKSYTQGFWGSPMIKSGFYFSKSKHHNSLEL